MLYLTVKRGNSEVCSIDFNDNWDVSQKGRWTRHKSVYQGHVVLIDSIATQLNMDALRHTYIRLDWINISILSRLRRECGRCRTHNVLVPEFWWWTQFNNRKPTATDAGNTAKVLLLSNENWDESFFNGNDQGSADSRS